MKKLLFVVICSLLAVICLSSCSALSMLTDSSSHKHVYDEWVTTLLPTCNTDGERERYCSCGQRQTSKLGALGHDIVIHAGVEVTCTTDGYEEYQTCRRCDFNNQVITPATGHDMSEVPARSPSCTLNGYEAHSVCLVCGYTECDEIPALGHDFGEWTETKPATCAEQGEEVRVCSHDETHIETRYKDKLFHVAGEWIDVTSATCEEDGEQVKKCTLCGIVVESRTIEAHGHEPGDWEVIKQASCLEDGEKIRKCTVCGYVAESQTISAHGHSFGEWEAIKPSTCSEEGEGSHVCLLCGYGEYSVIPKLEHVESDWITGIEPSCVQDGFRYKECLVCRTEIQSEQLTAYGHDYIIHFNEIYHYYVCSVCEEHGEQVTHNFEDNQCTECGFKKYAEGGIIFSLSGDGSYYSVKGVDNGITEIVIPSVFNGKPVSVIEEDAFRENTSVIKLYIPSSITFIGAHALFGCSNLSEITVPFMGSSPNDTENAFLGYIFGAKTYNENSLFVPTSLNKVTILDGLTEIEEYCFYACGNLSAVALPDTVEYIGINAFRNCTALTDVWLPENLIEIGREAFFGCGALESIVIPANTKIIGEYAFYGSNLQTAEFIRKSGWAWYDGEEKISDVPSATLNASATTAKYLKEYYPKYVWKRI